MINGTVFSHKTNMTQPDWILVNDVWRSTDGETWVRMLSRFIYVVHIEVNYKCSIHLHAAYQPTKRHRYACTDEFWPSIFSELQVLNYFPPAHSLSTSHLMLVMMLTDRIPNVPDRFALHDHGMHPSLGRGYVVWNLESETCLWRVRTFMHVLLISFSIQHPSDYASLHYTTVMPGKTCSSVCLLQP